MAKVKTTKLALKEWNRKVFGHVPTKIHETKQLLDTLQSAPPTALNLELEQKTQLELDELLLREQIHLKEKAKTLLFTVHIIIFIIS